MKETKQKLNYFGRPVEVVEETPKLEQARNRNSSFADLCAAFLADAEAKKVTPVRRRRYPRNQGDAAGEAAEALQARTENSK